MSSSCRRCISVIKVKVRSVVGSPKFSRAKSKAKERGHDWEIDQLIYFQLIQGPCEYCGSSVSNREGICLDRIDNNKGYLPDNVNACCYECNRARGDFFTVQEMIDEIGPAIKRIRQNRAQLHDHKTQDKV